MPRFLPAIDPRDVPVLPERLVYEALRGLDDDVVVLHSLPWLRPDRDRPGSPLREGEADFVILHPRRGLLVLEVKGGDVSLQDRRWTRATSAGPKDVRDPFEQARRNLHALLDSLESGTSPPLRRHDLVYGYGVIFPTHRHDGVLPPDADPRIVVDARGLGELPRRIDGMFQAFGARRAPLSPAQVKEALEVLAPRLRLTRCVGADLALDEARLIQLTETQQATLLGLLSVPRVLVEGVAGSGKTLLALEIAVAHAVAGRRTLLLCYNKHLARWAHERVSEEPRLVRAPGSVEVEAFHSLAGRLTHEAGVALEEAKEPDRFWDEVMPMAALQSVDVLRAEGRWRPYDAIVVDEGQDLLNDWWDVVRELLTSPDTSPLQVFFDRDQRLRAETTPPVAWLPARFTLDTSCRATAKVARGAAALVHRAVRLLPGTPEGETPRLLRARAVADVVAAVEAEVSQLLDFEALTPGQLVLIGPARWRNGSLAGRERLAGRPIVDDPTLWRQGKGLLCTTARAFKGLESDVVILYDLSGISERFNERDLYVAWTRAKHRLSMICQDGAARVLIERALADARRQ